MCQAVSASRIRLPFRQLLLMDRFQETISESTSLSKKRDPGDKLSFGIARENIL